ncbi:hypothetical protein [Flavobacterium sp.]|uniref:hypothetical protein n=1 Tax=Flavobacterium sp. TaxID=239 RepID=UPI00262ED14F|nr:hypothetical protein [Flavobacterium sp.]
MIRTFNILLLIFALQWSNAQETNCASKENTLEQYLKEKEYTKANEIFNDIKMNCLAQSEKSLQLGLQLQQYNIEIAPKENKEKEVREILGLFKLYDKSFPNNTNGNFEKSAMALYLNKVGTNDEVYALLDKAFEFQKKSFQNPEAIYAYLYLFIEKYKADKKTNTVDAILNKYVEVTSLLEVNKEIVPENIEIYDRVLVTMESLMKDYLVPDAVIANAKNNFQNKKSDVLWLQAMANILAAKAKNAPIFETVAIELNTIKPSSKSAYYLAIFNLNTAKQDQAITFFSESVKLEKNPMVKAQTAYTIASILSITDKEKSKEMVLTAINSNPTNGKYYIFLANLYADGVADCATTDFERNAIYKLASETVLKSFVVEPLLKGTAEQLSKSYLQKVVATKGKSKPVKLGCWINQTVTF